MIFSEVFEFHSDWSLKICGITSLIHEEDQLYLHDNMANSLKDVRRYDLHGCLARVVEDFLRSERSAPCFVCSAGA